MNSLKFDALIKQFSTLRAERIKSVLIGTNVWGRVDVHSDGLAILAPNGVPKMFNPAFEAITGITSIGQDDVFNQPSACAEFDTVSLFDNNDGSAMGPNNDVGLELRCILPDGFQHLDASLFQLEAQEVLCILWQPKEESLQSSAFSADLDYTQATRHSFANFLAVISALSDALSEEEGLSDSTSLCLKRIRQAVDKATADINDLDRCQSFERG
jgi:PAS domain-containing protein